MALAPILVLTFPVALPQSPGLADLRELTELVCIDCHQGNQADDANAAARLDLLAALDQPGEHLELLTTAFAQVRQGFMPPADAVGGGFDDVERDEWLTGAQQLVGDLGPGPGTSTLRRMTRRQLKRTLEMILGIEVPVERFLPRDASGYGFDTTGDTLFVTPLFYESWFECVDYVVDALHIAEVEPGELTGQVNLAAIAGADESAARTAIAALLRLAFSREPRAEEIDARRALMVVQGGPRDLGTWGDVLRATLLSQDFLYRIERGQSTHVGGAHDGAGGNDSTTERLGGAAMAARLAFFLFGSRPDAALLERMLAGAVESNAAMAVIVQEMLDDPRSRSLAEDFATQWLGTSELIDVTPDTRRFTSFNEGLRRSMGLEVIEFFDDLVRQDRSALECIDSEFVFIDKRLAKHYGIDGVQHGDIRRVPRPDRLRGGVLGMAGVLTVTSSPLRTSPVKRGQWVLERIIHAPAPPAPPNVGTLPEDDQIKDALSLREQLAQHRAQPSCAACHDQMDPYGLALERFDGVGKLRELDADAAPMALPDGTLIDGPLTMKVALLRDPRRFLESLGSALFTYAVGRPPTLRDLIELKPTFAACAQDGYRVRTLIQGIALCTAMTHRQRSR